MGVLTERRLVQQEDLGVPRKGGRDRESTTFTAALALGVPTVHSSESNGRSLMRRRFVRDRSVAESVGRVLND